MAGSEESGWLEPKAAVAQAQSYPGPAALQQSNFAALRIPDYEFSAGMDAGIINIFA